MNNDDSLRGLRLKRTRAWDEIHALQRDLTTFLEDPHPYVPRVHFNKETHTLTVSVHVQKTADPMWGVRIGEIVHNLRSALDHAVWELYVLTNKQPPPTRSKNQFPIFELQDGFDKRGRTEFLRGIRADAVDLIRTEQPFPKEEGGTGERDRSPLWHLKVLSDIDKHRTLHVTGAMVESFNFVFPPLKRAAAIRQQYRRSPGPIQQDVALARAIFEPSVNEWPFTKNEVKCTLRTDVAFDEGTPAAGTWMVLPTLTDIANRTDRILRRLATDIFKTDL